MQELKNSCRFPYGAEGEEMLAGMNEHHAPLTTWVLELLAPQPTDVILDIGCGGGRALRRVSPLVPEGKLYGVDYARTSVECTVEENADDVASGKLTVICSGVSDLPFDDAMFDRVYSIESYFFWPDLTNDMREILRVLKPGGRVVIASNVMRHEEMTETLQAEIDALEMNVLSAAEFAVLMQEAGYENVQILEQNDGRQLCALGTKPL